MTSYAVTARVQPATPRIRDHESTTWSMPTFESDPPCVVDESRMAIHRPAPRLESVRLTLAESTFYLFDPEGWR